MRKLWLSVGLCTAALLWLPGASFAQHHHARGFQQGLPPHDHFHHSRFHHGRLRPDPDRRFFEPRGLERDFDREFFRLGVDPRFVDPRLGPRFVSPFVGGF